MSPSDAQTQSPELDSQNMQRNASKVTELDGRQETIRQTAELGTEKPQLINQTGHSVEMDTPQRVAELEGHGVGLTSRGWQV